MRYLLERGVRKLARMLGVMIISREHYEALALYRSGRNDGGATPADAHRLPPPVPFPRLPGVGADTLSVHVVDVGAQPLSFEQDIYAPLVSAGPCHIVGFDPFVDPGIDRLVDEKAAQGLAERKGARITVLPYFIGDGNKARFHINAYSPTSSLFPSNLHLLNEFVSLAEMCATKSEIEVATRKLDEVAEIETCDFLKVDVQGGDFDVIAHGARVLDGTLFVHIEAEFAEIYAGQPLFSDIDALLRRQHFQFVDFVKLGWNNYKALPSSFLKSRLLWSDCIYMKNPERMISQDPRLLLRAAYIAHVNYRKYDLAAHLINLHDGHSGGSLHQAYISAVRPYIGQ